MTGNELRDQRIKAGLTCDMLGQRVGLSGATISRQELRSGRIIDSAKLRVGLIDVPTALDPYELSRDGVRPQLPKGTHVAADQALGDGPMGGGITSEQGDRIIALLEELLLAWGGP